MRRIAFILALTPMVAASVAAQRVPQRPRLADRADTNDARMYFELGLRRAEQSPGQAADAFSWAWRLDPLSPQTLYARGVAELLRNPARLVRYRERDPRTLASPEVRAIDSARYRAEMQDPFFHRGMDELLLMAYAKAAVRRDEWLGRGETESRTGLVAWMENFFEETDPYSRGQLYYAQGQLREALRYYGLAQRRRDLAWVWAERARVWAELRQLDSARSSLETALRLSRAGGGATESHVFESRAAWEYALGRIHEDRRDPAAAREAYHRVVGENPSYLPAYYRLGALAALARDTATALDQLSRAVARPEAPYFLLTSVAAVFTQLGQRDSAVACLRRATALEPLASAGWLLYAGALEAVADSGQAAQALERYLALAPQNDADRSVAAMRLARLRPGSAARP